MAHGGRFLLGIGCAAGLALAALGPATVASAAPASSPIVFLVGGLAKFTVGGRSWTVGVSNLGVGPSVTIFTSGEADYWTFGSLQGYDFNVKDKTGRATMVSHRAFTPVTSFDLRFTPKSRSHGRCKSGREAIFTGTMTGSFTLVANSHGLTFTSGHVRFPGTSVVVDYNCVPPSGPPPCAAGSWNARSGPVTSAAGSTPALLPGQHKFYASVEKVTLLSAPAGADLLTQVSKNVQNVSFSSHQRRLTVQAGHSGRVTGSIVMTGGPPTTTTYKCAINGIRYTEHETFYSGSFTHHLEAKSYAAGPITLPTRHGIGEFDIVTLNRS
jgi:hypothetical protein